MVVKNWIGYIFVFWNRCRDLRIGHMVVLRNGCRDLRIGPIVGLRNGCRDLRIGHIVGLRNGCRDLRIGYMVGLRNVCRDLRIAHTALETFGRWVVASHLGYRKKLQNTLHYRDNLQHAHLFKGTISQRFMEKENFLLKPKGKLSSSVQTWYRIPVVKTKARQK